jgi:hypothetical protein
LKLGIGSYTYPYLVASRQMDHFELLETGLKLGAETIQYCENLSLADLAECDLAELLSAAAQNEIGIEVGTRGLDKQELTNTACLARRVGAGFFRLVVHDLASDVAREDVGETLGKLLGGFEGVVVAIENHDHFPAEELRHLVEKLGTKLVGVTLDTANSLGCLEGTREVVRTLAPYTTCLHVKDVQAKRIETNLGFAIHGATAGRGSVDIPWVLSQMTNSCQSVILEQWTPEQPAIPTPEDRELESAAEGFGYMRGLIPFNRRATPAKVGSL